VLLKTPANATEKGGIKRRAEKAKNVTHDGERRIKKKEIGAGDPGTQIRDKGVIALYDRCSRIFSWDETPAPKKGGQISVGKMFRLKKEWVDKAQHVSK